jgi:uncharacterized membrane protein YfcA
VDTEVVLLHGSHLDGVFLHGVLLHTVLLHGVFLNGAFLLVAGIVAGVIGTSGGITSLLAYPALLAVGIPPLAANVTSSVALIGSGLSSAAIAGPDLKGHAATVHRWMPPVVLVSFAGAVLLVTTPGEVFDVIVPFLVAAGATILLLQPRIAAWQQSRDRAPGRLGVALSGGAVALYNGYFGAGAGILMITVLLLTTEPQLHRANSLKNVILVAADILPAVLFAVLGRVVWAAVWPLGAGALIGGLIGPHIARRVPRNLMRILISCCGYVLAIYLFVTAF